MSSNIKPTDEINDCLGQVYRMAMAAAQSHTFWLYTRENSPYIEQMRQFPGFFYATNEAHLTNMIISLDALYDNKPKLQNFTKLFKLVESKLDKKDWDALASAVRKLRKLADGIRIIRNNSFAHVANVETRNALGQKHALSKAEMLTLVFHGLRVVKNIITLLGKDAPSSVLDGLSVEQVFDRDLDEMKAIFVKLGGKSTAG